MKNVIFGFLGAFGSFIAGLFGGWDSSFITLLIFMIIDFVTGIVCAGVFHKSNKSKTGALESRAGWKGLIRKGITLFIVVVANRLDVQLGTTYIRDAVCIMFICNEAISIIENAGLMGVPIPNFLKEAIELLKSNTEKKNK